ncbi:hypothetical protein Amsp01_048530 [Amycolatopsis sp. NBRC 101858]|uniref:hypothetical protein n=1 Tax=Amycolatopsis sp. NBRC 101858 TaxID=3032200 RepID=UPI0024A42477|nr:hypothetical protein [Amycolatopsis sp. NBRC 101858]GLY38829.1 hypothetical protein Amsp01_048530 [Amycolatopsis sp. NBRC 101858]
MNERGDITVEAAVGVIALVVLFGLGLVGIRVLVADSAIDDAARSAARAASIAQDGRSAAAAAERRARVVLAEQHLSCGSLDVAVDTGDFVKPLGETGYVVATVTCEMPLADLAIPGIGGTKSLTARFKSPIDRYGAQR